MANFTKQAIKAAFLELLDEKPLNKISVRDIVERCGINRNSFYYHFQDIPSLLGEIIVERTNELMAQYPTVDRIEEAFRASIDYAQKNRRAIMHVYNSVSRDTFEASVMRLCAYMTEQYLKSAYPDTGISDADRELLHRFIECQLFGLCIDWMLGGMKPDTGEKMGRILELYRGVAELILENAARRTLETFAAAQFSDKSRRMPVFQTSGFLCPWKKKEAAGIIKSK